MSKAAQNIVAALDGLSPAELAEIAAQASARSQLLGRNPKDGSIKEVAPSNDEALVYGSIETALRPHLGTIPGFGAFARRHTKYKAYVEGVQRMVELVESQFRPKSKPERIKALDYLCGLIVRHRVALRRRKPGKIRPVDMFSFIDDMIRIREIVEEQFPEYISNGLLRILLRRQLN